MNHKYILLLIRLQLIGNHKLKKKKLIINYYIVSQKWNLVMISLMH